MPLLEAAEANALPTDKPATSRTVNEDILDSEEYITTAEDMLFDAGRYVESHPPQPSTTSTEVSTVSIPSRGQKVSFRPMTHDDCRLWFAQLEDVFLSQGITSQINKFAALTTLLTEEEAYVVRDLTLLGNDRPADVFKAAKTLFVQRFELTVHQRLTRALAMGGMEVDEKPSQWMARFRHTGGDWTREDVERWALMRRLPSSLRTTLEMPSPPLPMEELLRKADALYDTLPPAIESNVNEMSPELVTAVYACDVSTVSALFRKRGNDKHNDDRKPKSRDAVRLKSNIVQCWYHEKFGNQANFCSGPPCQRHHPDLPKGKSARSGNAMGGQ